MEKEPTVTIWDSHKIKQARIDRNLSEPEAAKLLDVTPVFLTMLETGKRQPSPRTITKIASTYRRPISHFLLPDRIPATA